MGDKKMERIQTIFYNYDQVFDKSQDQAQVWRGLSVRSVRDEDWDIGFILVCSPEMEEGISGAKMSKREINKQKQNKCWKLKGIPIDKIKTSKELWWLLIELPQDLRKVKLVVMAMVVVTMIIGEVMAVLHVDADHDVGDGESDSDVVVERVMLMTEVVM